MKNVKEKKTIEKIHKTSSSLKTKKIDKALGKLTKKKDSNKIRNKNVQIKMRQYKYKGL